MDAEKPPRRSGLERTRTNDPERTKAELIEVAMAEFAANGLTGARVDAIAERTRTSKRMIYYYFGSKEGLYLAVLEKAYGEVRALEAELDLAGLDPESALRALIDRTFENDDAHGDFIRLVTIENIHRAEHIVDVPAIRQINERVTGMLGAILERGRAAGLFRADLDPIDVHLMISAFCFFRVSNQHTFGAIFDVNLSEPTRRARHKGMIADAVLGALRIR
ncbi:TetR family transcriptional regulator [Aureimonas sp. D3]|uniref:TetR family transcriptional regulator n=1 Tax=Aureimonas sp. D3 TaxID=1638164 RepID=UPI0007860E2D|nr:TetR family transcriptional regulator [Aureimonas sp. D3]